jgi:hypothetical protein
VTMDSISNGLKCYFQSPSATRVKMTMASSLPLIKKGVGHHIKPHTLPGPDYIPRGNVLIWSGVLPAMRPSPTYQDPLHSLQTGMSFAAFIPPGHSPIFKAH